MRCKFQFPLPACPEPAEGFIWQEDKDSSAKSETEKKGFRQLAWRVNKILWLWNLLPFDNAQGAAPAG